MDTLTPIGITRNSMSLKPAKGDYNLKYAIYVSVLYSIGQVFTGMLSLPLAPISSAVSKAYGLTDAEINLSTSLFSIGSLFTGIPANKLIVSLGIRNSANLGVILMFVGMLTKLAVPAHVYFIHLGQFIAGCGAPIFLNGITNFGHHWFKGSTVCYFNYLLEDDCSEHTRSVKPNRIPLWFCISNSLRS